MASAREALVQTLGDSASQVDHARVRDATVRLEEWRTQPGFFVALQDIFLDSNIPEEIRFQSILYLKNHLDRYWRKTAKSAIAEEEKSLIRTHLIHALQFHFPNPWIATNAYTIGRIARHDFPRFWPDLVMQLLDTVRRAFEIEEQGQEHEQEQWRIENGLTGLRAVVKELASVKLGMAVVAFRQITPEIFRFLGQMYQHITSQWIEKLPAVSPKMAISAKILGIMRTLLVYGYERPGEQIDVQEFFDLSVQHLREFYPLYNNFYDPTQEQILNHISKLTKLFSAYAAARPFEFLIMHNAPTVISAFIQICRHEAKEFNKPAAETNDTNLPVLSKVVINALSSIKSIMKALSDPKVIENEEERGRKEQVAVANSTLETIFNPTTVLDLAALLWTGFLILRHCDLEAWEEDPEGWFLEVSGEIVSADSGLRTTGEALFMELVFRFKDEMIEFFTGCIQTLQHPHMMTHEQVIFREALYNAITLNALSLYDLIDFDEWLVSVIPAELSYSGPHTKIIRRRMALLISAWVGTKCAESSRPKVYETLLSLLTPLDPRNDAAVRLSAASAFRNAVDEWHFKVDDFLPYLDAVLIGTPEEHDTGGLIGLMGFVQQIETRMKLLSVVDNIVDRCDRRIIPYVPSIMNLLPYLWDQSENQKVFRASVLASLQNLVGALGERSVDYHAFIVRLITLGTDPDQQEEFRYLFEDALNLWEETIKNAPTEIKDQEPLSGPEYNIMGLFPRAIKCLQLGSENLRSILRIIELYIILDPLGIMRRYADKLFAGLAALTVDLKPEAHRMVMNVIEVAIQGCPLDLYFATFVESGLFFKILAAVIDDNENMIVTSQNMNILARLALQNPDLLLHYLRTVDPSPDIVSRFVDKWAGPKFDSIGLPKSRKLNAMGLTALLRTNDKDVLNNVGAIINVWFNVVSEVKDNDGGDALIYWRNEEEEDTFEFGVHYAPSATDRRRRLFLQNDPVHTTNLMTFMKDHLTLAQTTLGGAEVFREVCLRNMDDALVEQMNTMFL